ncbi:hypothetical protein M1349_05750 [Patescibacteria group bacterium]|nr:hypothetical protein [Patescibacteria group bacterium]
MKTTKVFFVLILFLFLTILLQNSRYQNKKETKKTTLPSTEVKTKVTQTPSPTEESGKVPTLVPTALPEANSYVYPNSFNYSKKGERISFQTNDDPQTVTDWYKSKIDNLGLSTQSFVQTSSNDNVLNKLVAASGDKEIRVEISKNSREEITEIKLVLRNL